MNVERSGPVLRPDEREDSQEEAFRRIYEDNYGPILAYCLRRLAHADAHDAVAEVFSIAWRKLGDAPPDDKIRSWLYGIAYRVPSHHWRGRRRAARLRDRVAHLRSVDPAGPEALAVRRSGQSLVLEAAARLREPDQEILRLAGWEEMAHGDIASLLGISVAAVDQRFHRAKRRLADEYQKLEADRGGRPAGRWEGT